MSTFADDPRPRARPPGLAPPPTPPGVAPAPDAAPVTYREEDPRTRAARRAAELRDHGSLSTDGTDEFFIDPRVIPDGWSYEWKRHTTLGAQDPSYQVSLARSGWESVPAKRHPEMMPDHYTGMTIERNGMILMERPKEITDEAKARDYRKARDQVRQKEAQLSGAPAGQFERDNKGTPLVNVKKGYEAIPIPRE
jgi:hypothetical protein